MYHVGDYIFRIKNAYMARKKSVTMPYSNINKDISKVLVKEGFISGIKEEDTTNSKVLVAELRYENRRPVLHDVLLVSKPSVRVYFDNNALKSDRDKAKTIILTTSLGVMTGKDALKKGIGGEILFKIW